MKLLFQLILILILLTNCAGYKLRSKSNPLASLNINTIAVPMFINKTTLDKVSGTYTTKAIEVLAQYSKLKISAGNIHNEDAVLLGIIRPTKLSNRGAYIKSHSLMTTEQKEEIGDRNTFEVPTSGRFDLTVDIFILKRPSKEEIEFYTTELGRSMTKFPNTILSHSIQIAQTYSIENPVGNKTSGAVVRGTQNRGKLRKSLIDSAEIFENDFREILSNAF